MSKLIAKNKQDWGLHWFRRDLRVTGNEALHLNRERHDGRVLGLFSFDSQFLSRDDFSANRFAFFLRTLRALRDELQASGGDLLIVDEMPQKAFRKILSLHKPKLVTWNRDYEPYARKRDDEILSIIQGLGVAAETFRDHLILQPYEVLKSEKVTDFYQVYSPYGKKWFKFLHEDFVQERFRSQEKALKHYKSAAKQVSVKTKPEPSFAMRWKDLGNAPYPDALEKFESANVQSVSVPIPDAGFAPAFSALLDFKKKIQSYKVDRDIPSLPGTSRLSIFLKNGSLTTAQTLVTLGLTKPAWDAPGSETQFVKEIAWREFYYSILFHRPDVETSAFHKQYANLDWENNKNWFERWKTGTTGFPIVDAGMRELLTTGWMHNRVRMIVASFLTKDLLIDWRWGEQHFMKYLLDGDLAPNNGGWQWAASTGCDPQPYFRVFNPWLQSEKFDREGLYIKKFVPELAGCPAKALHDPLFNRKPWIYPDPLVQHGAQRDKAIALYKKFAKS